MVIKSKIGIFIEKQFPNKDKQFFLKLPGPREQQNHNILIS